MNDLPEVKYDYFIHGNFLRVFFSKYVPVNEDAYQKQEKRLWFFIVVCIYTFHIHTQHGGA